MAELPVQAGHTVDVRQAPTGFSQANFTPEDTGAGIARGLMQAGQAIGEIAANERRMKADFDAVEADHEFVKQEATAWEEFKTKYRPDQYKDHLADYQSDLEKLSPRVMQERKLNDPLAQKAFHIMTRRRIDFRMAHAIQFAGDQYEKWQDNAAVGAVANAVTMARESPPTVAGDVVDTRDIGLSMQEASHLRMERLGKQMPADKAAGEVHRDMVKILEGALNGYIGSDDPNAADKARKFMNAPIVGMNDANGIPLTAKRILGAGWEAWERKIKHMSAEKDGAKLGYETYMSAGKNPVKANEDLSNLYGSKQISFEVLQEAQKALKAVADHEADYTHRQLAKSEAIVYEAFNKNGFSTVGAFQTPEQREAWANVQSTDLPRRLAEYARKDEARDMEVALRWTEWLTGNYDEASKMNLDQLLQVARDPKKVGMSAATEKYVMPLIQHFMTEKAPLRKRGEQEQFMEARVDFMHAMGKEFDPARPELNRWENWPDPVERRAYAMFIGKVLSWYNTWRADPKNAHEARPSPEDFQKGPGQYLEMVSVPAGDRSFWTFGEVKEPKIKQLARESLRAGAKTSQPVAPEAPVSVPSNKRAEIEAGLRQAGIPVTDEAVQSIWKDMQGK